MICVGKLAELARCDTFYKYIVENNNNKEINRIFFIVTSRRCYKGT